MLHAIGFVVGAIAFWAAHGVEAAHWHDWFHGEYEPWFLNSGRGILFTMGCVWLASALTASDVVAVVPIVSPRQQWGCAFVSTDLRGASFGAEDDGALGGFADQLALALDAAALLTRAVAVERSLAHAEKLATIGETAARIAHDIRNPVAVARSLAQELASDLTSPLTAEPAGLMLEALDRVEHQVRGLLRFARRDELRLEPVDLGLLVRATVADLRGRLESAEIAVALTAPDEIVAGGDREKLRQVVINLVENAIDALAERPQARELGVAVSAAARCAVLCIRDNGPGIPADALPHVFDPFFSLKTAGTGLGLAIVKRTVDAHGGRIAVGSTSGQGTTFEVVLPLDAPA